MTELSEKARAQLSEECQRDLIEAREYAEASGDGTLLVVTLQRAKDEFTLLGHYGAEAKASLEAEIAARPDPSERTTPCVHRAGSEPPTGHLLEGDGWFKSDFGSHGHWHIYYNEQWEPKEERDLGSRGGYRAIAESIAWRRARDAAHDVSPA
jgi:hypothetical protein